MTVTDDGYIQKLSSDIDVERFQCFSWSSSQRTLFYSRKLFGVKMAYSISFNDNSVKVLFGKNYYRIVRHRFMNLHDSYYLLSDLANIFLLKNGYSTMYCGAVQHCESGKVAAIFSPPNMGKSFTVKRLCDTGDYKLIAEDVALLDKKIQIHGCQWTCTYRTVKTNSLFLGDSGGALTRVHENIREYEAEQNLCNLSYLILLTRAMIDTDISKSDIEKRLLILNKYRFCGYNSPIVNVLAFFDWEFDQAWEDIDKSIMKTAFLKCDLRALSAEFPNDFSTKINAVISGSKNPSINNS